MDLTGQRFGRWIVLGEGTKKYWWSCQCDCGRTRDVIGGNLRSGISTGCGCVTRATKHNRSGDPVYRVWLGMNARCHNLDHAAYHLYGGRGIHVWEKWRNPDGLEAFVEYMGARPEGGTLERIDNNMGYSPGNVRWATFTEQARNRRGNVGVTYEGRTQCIAAWAAECNMSRAALRYRLNHGWSVHDALTTTPDHTNRKAS